jgi:hypothetical protein
MIMEIVDLNNASITQLGSDLATSYMGDVPDRIREWISDFKITADLGFRASEQEVQDAAKPLVDHVRDRLGENLAEWMAGPLSAAIAGRLKATESQVREREQKFLQKARRIRQAIAGGQEREARAEKRVDLPDIAINFGSGPKTVDVSPALRAAAGAIVAGGAALGAAALMALAFPVGLIAVAAAAIFGALAGKGTVQDAIKEQVLKNLLAGTEKGKKPFIDNVKNVVAREVRKRRDAFEARLAGELNSIRGDVNFTLKEKEKGEAEAEREMNRLRAMACANREVEDKLAELLFEAGLSQ